MKIRHTVIFTFYDSTTEDQITDLIHRLTVMGEWLEDNLDVTDWIVARHIPETSKQGRAHVLQDGVFPSIKALEAHSSSEVHDSVIALSPKISDWMTIDTIVPEDTTEIRT